MCFLLFLLHGTFLIFHKAKKKKKKTTIGKVTSSVMYIRLQ